MKKTLKAAKAMDVLGNKEARIWVSMVKAMVPERTCKIIDQAIQMHGATGISQWTPLAEMYQDVRHLRFADGPDEVLEPGNFAGGLLKELQWLGYVDDVESFLQAVRAEIANTVASPGEVDAEMHHLFNVLAR